MFHVPFGPFYCAKLKKFFRVDPDLWSHTISRFKMTNLPKWYFFGKTINVIFMYLLAPLFMQNFKKLLEWIQRYDDVPFSGQNGPFALNEIFFWKSITISSMYLLVPSIVQNFKKIVTIFLKWDFSQKDH